MRWYILTLLFVLTTLTVHAEPTLTFPNESFQPGETIIGSVTGFDLLEALKDEDIAFYEGRKKVFLESSVTGYNGTYYFYIYTNREGNFSMNIGPLLYTTGTNIAETTLTQEFSVHKQTETIENSTGTKILMIKPGVVRYTKTNHFTLYNVGDFPLDIEVNEEELTLNKTENYNVFVEPQTDVYFITVDTYKQFMIPIIPSPNNTIIERHRELGALTINISLQELQVQEGETYTQKLTYTNTKNESIYNITFTSEIPFITFEPTTITELESNQSITTEMSITAEGRGNLRKTVEATYAYKNESGILTLPITLLIVPTGYNKENITKSPLTCEEEGGTVCGGSEICNGEATYSKDGQYCCLAKCVEINLEEETSNTGLYIGIGILLLLGIIGFWAYRRQKKTKNTQQDPIVKAVGKPLLMQGKPKVPGKPPIPTQIERKALKKK